jgi:hypothetical protein
MLLMMLPLANVAESLRAVDGAATYLSLKRR